MNQKNTYLQISASLEEKFNLRGSRGFSEKKISRFATENNFSERFSDEKLLLYIICQSKLKNPNK